VNTREFDRNAPVSGHWQQRLLNGYPQLEGKNWLLMPAPLTPGMGHPTFLQMLAAVVREREDAFGLIVGETPEGDVKYARKLEKMALDLGLSDKVLFLGERRDMRELYASSQICYSLCESPQAYGLTANEALAMNCPVVTYEKSGAAELLQQCFPQGLVEQGNPDALAAASLQILERPHSITFHGFSHEDAAMRTLALYREVCGAE
jgi:glycosyltransferase involved in cell wall biosynthesis